jgi:hypothetical protein
MPRLQNKTEQLWSQRVVKSLVWRKKYSFETTWPAIDNFYRHKFEKGQEDLPHFNLIYMMGQNLIPSLVFQSPGIINTPQNDHMTFMSGLWDSIDNWWIRTSDMKEIAKEAVLSSYLHNTTAAQIGYDFGTEADTLRNNMTEVFGEVEGTTNRARRQNAPWVDYVPSHRYITAVGTRSMRNCIWAGKLVSVPTRILKKQKGLTNVVSTKIPEEILRHERYTWEGKDPDKWTHFWQIHDAENKEWFWLGTHGKYISAPQEDPLQVFGLPFEVLSFNTNADSIFGTPDAEYIRSQQLEGDELRMHSMFQRRFSLPKCVYNTNVIPPAEMNKMLEATVAPAIAAKLGDGGEDDIRKHVYMFAPPTSYMLHREYGKDLLNDAQLINGFGPNQLGMQSPGRHTKYETQVAEASSSARLAYRRYEVAQMIQGLVIRANMLMSRYWTGDIVEKVVGVDGAMYWVKAGPEELKEYKDGLVTEVNVESLAPVSRERRKAEAAELLGLLGNMGEAGVNTLPLIKQLLSTYEWIDVSQVLPQMTGEYELAHWEQMQRKKLEQGGQGQAAANNLQGLNALASRLPPEQQQVNYSEIERARDQ